MKAYMIADLNNPVSVEYTEIARESWTPILNDGIFTEIEVVQCYTPETFTELEPLYNWRPLLHGAQMGQTSSPSERAGDISHWQMIKRRAESNERFFVMEHDAFLLDADEFKRQIDFTLQHGLDYANLGLYMSCYSLSKQCAEYAHHLLVNRAFPLNGGPYGCMERLVKTFLSDIGSSKEYTFMTHYGNEECVGIGRTSKHLFNVYNGRTKSSPFRLSSTQVIKKSAGITQNHTGHKLQDEPWRRSKNFHVID